MSSTNPPSKTNKFIKISNKILSQSFITNSQPPWQQIFLTDQLSLQLSHNSIANILISSFSSSQIKSLHKLLILPHPTTLHKNHHHLQLLHCWIHHSDCSLVKVRKTKKNRQIYVKESISTLVSRDLSREASHQCSILTYVTMMQNNNSWINKIRMNKHLVITCAQYNGEHGKP